MLCAISGEVPQVPVVSRKSGNVYEKRLVESYISENGTEPATGEVLTVEDLLEIKTAQSVRPRPPTMTSIPALLNVFQEEWDALALETHTLQKNLAHARQQLSTALFQHDAAVRAIAKLAKERDEARQALAQIDVGRRVQESNGVNGDAMQVDNAALSDTVISKIDATQERLMKTRRKRPTPEGWATTEDISNLKLTIKSGSVYPAAKFIALNSSGDLALLGGSIGNAGVFSRAKNEILYEHTYDSAITGGVWSGKRAVVATSSGAIKIFEEMAEVASFKAHSRKITGLTLHPNGDILASVSEDKSYVLYDLESMKVLTQVFTNSALLCTQFHPDGHLLALGGADGQIKFYDVKSGAIGGTFDTGSALSSLYFSENGTWVAAANVNSSVVSIWDLRKAGVSHDPLKTIDVGGVVESLCWDYTAQYLLVGGPGGISVQQYTKSTKEWSEPLRLAVPVTALTWGSSARSVLATDENGSIQTIE